MIRIEVLPVFAAFIEANKKELADGLKQTIAFTINAVKALGRFFTLIANNLGVIQALGSVIFGIFVSTKVITGILVIQAGIKGLITLFGKQTIAATLAGRATAFATGGATALAAIAGLGAFYAFEKLTGSINVNTEALKKNSEEVAKYGENAGKHLGELKSIEKATKNANLQTNFTIRNLGNLNKKTKEQIQLEQVLAKLKKMGVTTKETDPITLEAARLNLLRQNRIAEAARVEEMLKAFEAQMKMNEAAQRYSDLLTVLSDQVISDEEVSVLASKWNITKGEVLEYIARIYAANSTEIDEGPVIKLLMAWGLTKEEAQKYVDFTRALKDEKLDDSEIEKLMGKWGMTRAEVIAYAGTVQAGTALQKVLAPNWAEPGDAAAEAWRRALAALNAYLAALNSGKPTNIPPPSSSSSSSSSASTSVTPSVTVQNPFNPSSTPVTTSSLQENIDTLKDLRKSVESGTAISFLLKEHIDTMSDSLTTTALSALGDERERLRAIGTFDRPGITSTSTFDPAAFRMSENAGMTVNVTVQGNVQTEKDLADAIRQRILLEQQSGKPILFVGGL